MARVGTAGFGTRAAGVNIKLDTVTGALFRSADFQFTNEIVEGQFGPGAGVPVNFEVFVNGNLLRPVIDTSGASPVIKTFTGATDPVSVSFAGLNGDYAFTKTTTGGPPFIGSIVFPFALLDKDEVQVRYFVNKF
jgi:hypothetical protein